jgi:hypothetical protein
MKEDAPRILSASYTIPCRASGTMQDKKQQEPIYDKLIIIKL